MKRMESQLATWRAKIDELLEQAETAAPQAGLEYHLRIDDLKAKCAITQSKLDILKATPP